MEHDSQEIRLCALVLSVVAFFLFIAAEIVHEERSAPSRGVLLLVAIGALAFAWIGPLTLLAGTLRSKAFQWWQPFRGGAEFVWMQAFGWWLHTFVLTGAVVVIANAQVPKWFQGQYLLLGAMGFMAQILLNLSIGCFREVVGGDETDQGRAFQFPLTTKAVVSLLVSASGTLMFVCYDLFSHLGQSPVMVALGSIEFIVSALVIHVLYGCGEIPGFHIWQPFEGEKTFLLLQYLGWQLFAFTIGGALNVFFSADDQSGYESSKGTGTAIGAMGMMSQVLLLVSLQYFDESSAKAERRSQGEDQQEKENATFTSSHGATKMRKRPAEVYVASLLCVGALGVGCLSYTTRAKLDVLPEAVVQFFLAHERVGWVISLSSLAIAAPIANMGGVRSKPAYLWWQPFQGGTKFVFLQTIGWLWYGFYLALAIVLCMNSSKFGDIAGCLVLIVGLGGAGAIAMSLSYFQSSTPLKTVGGNGKVRYSYWSDAIKGEVTMVMLFSLSSTLFHFLVDYFQDQMTPSIRAFCLVLAMALFVLASTVSHFSGRKLYSQFRLWQPFEGGDRYVIRQAVGWALVGVQLLFDSLLLTLVSQAIPFGVLSVLGVFAVAPQALILSSVQYFQPSESSANSQANQTTCGSGWQTRKWSTLIRSSTLRWHTGSNVFVVLGSLCLFVSAEILGSRRSSFQRAEEVLYIFGCLLSSYGIVFTHCILGPKVHPTYRVFQPFRGGIKFITFHGAAWTVVSVAWALSMTAIYWSSVFFEIPGIHLITGLLYIVPQSILLYSIPLFRPTDERSASRVQGKERQSEQNLKAEDLANQFFVGRLLGFAGCAVFVLVDLAMVRWGPSIPVFPMTVSAVLALFSSIPLSYKFASSNYGTKAKSIGGGIVFVVLGCALWSFTLLLGGLFSYNLWKTQHVSFAVTSVSEPTKYLGTFTGSVGFTAQLLFFQASESSHFKSELGIKLPLEEKLFMTVSNLKKHLAFASIWVYSSVPLVAGLLYAHTKSVLPKHLATSQIFVLLLCSAAVIWSAWWIQQQIVSTGCAYLPHDGARKLQAKASASVAEALTQGIPMLNIGLDCYVQIAAFLSVSELIICSSTSRRLSRLHSEDFWKQVFVERFFANRAKQFHQLPAKRHLPTGTPLSNLTAPIAIGATPFAATTLNRVESAAVNLICRLKCVPSYNAPRRLATVNMRSKWKAFCMGGEKQFIFEQCAVCKQVDAVNSSLKRWEQSESCSMRAPSTWVTVCKCVNPATLRYEKAHRACLEMKLKDGDRQSTAPTPTAASSPLEPCSVCETRLITSERLPKTMRELLQATWEDFRRSGEDFGGGFFVFVPASASLFIFCLKKVGWGSWAMYAWVVTIVALCFIINSPRFDRCLAHLGGAETPSFQAYQRAYHALAMSSIMSLAWCCPTMNQAEAASSPSLIQMVTKVAFRGNCAFFFALSAAAFLAFWRTQYRIATVDGAEASTRLPEEPNWSEDTTSREESGSANAEENSGCVLCLLKLCDSGMEQ